jgi:hypothetical protein
MNTHESQLYTHNCPSSDKNVQAPTVEEVIQLNDVFAPYGILLMPLVKGDKIPHKGFRFTSATNNPEILRSWVSERYIGCNIAYLLPLGIVVLDFDPRNSPHGHAIFEQCERTYGAFPATWTNLSGRNDHGRHLLYALPVGVTAPYCDKALELGEGVQILGTGHYLVAPPSIHPMTHQPYLWDTQNNPFTMPLTLAPEWLVRHLQSADLSSRGESLRQDTRHSSSRKQTEHARYQSPSAMPSSRSKSKPSTLRVPSSTASNDAPMSRIRGLYAQEHNWRKLLPLVGLPADVRHGQTVRCPLPHHTHGDKTPSATFYAPNGEHPCAGINCHKFKREGDFYSLPTLYHMLKGGNTIGNECSVTWQEWAKRLLVDAGILHLSDAIAIPALPKKAPKDSRQIWDVIIDIRSHRAITRGWKAPMPCTWRFLKDWCADLAEWTEYRIQKAVAYLIAIGVHKMSHTEGDTILFILGTRRERRASQDAEPVGKNVKTNVDIATEAQAHMYEDAAPLRRTGQGEDIALDTDCGVCTVCAAALDTDGIAYFCSSCGWDERASPVCA